MEQTAAQERHLLRAISRHSLVGMAVIEAGRVTYANDAVVNITGRSRAELYAMEPGGFTAVIHPDDREATMAYFAKRMAGEPGVPEQYDVRIVAADGSVKWVANRAESVEIGGKQVLVASIVDITAAKSAESEKRDLEAQLRQHQKLEAVGTLAAGVAHEINNPITGILNYAQIIAKRSDENEEIRQFAEGIISESWQVSSIVKNLLAFSRQERMVRTPHRIGDIMEDTLLLVRTLLRRDQIGLEVKLPDDLPPVACRAQQIQQVLMNLLTNARDALLERHPGDEVGKTIAVTGEAFEKGGADWIRLTVSDHGAGIRPEIANRVFDPFFTTKPFGTGTGLGLSVSYGIVHEHGGELHFESDESRGTRFHLDLPVEADGSDVIVDGSE
jgi:PAS domain S-box-containing protein